MGWSFAIYKSKENFILKKWTKEFYISKFDLKNNEIDGIADPFLISNNNKLFVFFELIKNRKGEIWVAGIEKKMVEPKKVLSKNYHLSFPNVFFHNGEFYMIPESSEINTVQLFKSTSFPYEWELSKIIFEGHKLVDTVHLCMNEVCFWITYDLDCNMTRIYFSDSLMGIWNEHPRSPFKTGRNAGSLIFKDNKIIRPVQVSEKSYGEGVVLYEIAKIDKYSFEEHIIDKEFLTKKNGFRLDGCHHLSVCELVEKTLIAVDGKNNNFYSVD